MISTLNQLVESVRKQTKKPRLAVAWAQDENTLRAVHRAAVEGLVDVTLLGDKKKILGISDELNIDIKGMELIHVDSEQSAARKAVSLIKTSYADILMKGLVGTDLFLQAIMDRDEGIMKPKATLSYVGALQIPEYHKLLFITDPAVLPFPNLNQKVAMSEYAIDLVRRFGIETPKVALIGASEKMSKHFQNSVDYAVMCKMAQRGQIRNCLMDGPLDIFLACDKESVRIKGVDTPINGDADILLFPSLESSNPFCKSLLLFAKGEMTGLLMGTTAPVVLLSRSEGENSKFYGIALSCLMVKD